MPDTAEHRRESTAERVALIAALTLGALTAVSAVALYLAALFTVVTGGEVLAEILYGTDLSQ